MSPKITMPKALLAKFKAAASRGGKNGTGKSKARGRAHYERIRAIRAENRKARLLAESTAGNVPPLAVPPT